MLCALCCVLLGACKTAETASETVAASAPSMEQALIDKLVAAQGGRDAMKSLTSLRMTGEVYMPSVGMTMPLTITQKRPNKAHIRVEVPSAGMEVVNAYDGETAWQINPMMGGTQKVTGEQARTFREQADIDGILVDYAAKGYAVEYVGDADVKGTPAKKLRVIRPDSSEVFVYLDGTTFLQVKTEGEGADPMSGAKTTVETFISDYRDVDGRQMAFKMEVVMGGLPFQTVTMKDIKTNVAVDDALFAYPKQ